MKEKKILYISSVLISAVFLDTLLQEKVKEDKRELILLDKSIFKIKVLSCMAGSCTQR